MPQRKWSRELIIMRIRALRAQGSDLTPGMVSARDGPLVSAAERYFGSWPAAVAAAGVDYAQVRASGRQRRRWRISKWSCEKIVAEILWLHRAGEGLSWAVAERKYPQLCAAAAKKCYFGSWRAALEAAGLDYDEIKARAREARCWRARWHRELTGVEEPGASAPAGPRRAGRRRETAAPTAPAGWERQLLREKAAEETEKHAQRSEE
jgi:hypothetical protein